MAAAWEEVTQKCMNCICKRVLKMYVSPLEGFDQDADDVCSKKVLALETAGIGHR